MCLECRCLFSMLLLLSVSCCCSCVSVVLIAKVIDDFVCVDVAVSAEFAAVFVVCCLIVVVFDDVAYVFLAGSVSGWWSRCWLWLFGCLCCVCVCWICKCCVVCVDVLLHLVLRYVL